MIGFPPGREGDVRAYVEAVAGSVVDEFRISSGADGRTTKLHLKFQDAATCEAALDCDESDRAVPGSILAVRVCKETVCGTLDAMMPWPCSPINNNMYTPRSL